MMRIFSHQTLLGVCILACSRSVDAAINASGIFEVDLMFPRNDTYAPTSLLPVVFAFQNPKLMQYITPYVSFGVMEYPEDGPYIVSRVWGYPWGNISGEDPVTVYNSLPDPFFSYKAYTDDFNIEGTWVLDWIVGRDDCTTESLSLNSSNFMRNTRSGSVVFTTKNSSQAVDLVSSNQTCSGYSGVAINITHTLQIPSSAQEHWQGAGEICGVVASSTPSANPCRVEIDAEVASSMSSSMESGACRSLTPIGIAQRLAIGGAVCLITAIAGWGAF
ncbi:hypothetical protein EDB81DRAFT_451254 [Dactylonectria macrodidyma]|uniref:DUF7136 domain-containing protein n=1 Tax=Dactylonectria macrodidyma TaxID=307937 RepID=A0A9P9F513_9HYPO|nr:hypothetical protein EDB81DRAFT_451254 [Dactylonectria macrodidyma]